MDMLIHPPCRKCGTRLDVAIREARPGAEFACPKCGAIMTVRDAKGEAGQKIQQVANLCKGG